MSEPIVVHTEIVNPESGERRLTVRRWPAGTLIDEVALVNADPDVMRRDGDTVTITVSNGRAVYQLGEPSVYSMAYPAYLISSRLTEER